MRQFLLAFSILSASFPAQAQILDKAEDYKLGAIWKEIESRPDTKATPDMPAVDMIVVKNSDRSSSVVMGWMMRTNWGAGENLKLEKGFSVLIARPCTVVIPECYVAQGLWLELKRTAHK